MGTRISTAANLDSIVQRMLDQQTSVNNLQQQIGTGFKAQDYTGLAPDVSQLLNLQNEAGRIQNYLNNNNSVATNLNLQLTSVQGITTAATDMQSALLSFTSHDLNGNSPMNTTDVQNIQTQAFDTLNQISYLLNQQVDGKYIFGGGRNDAPPIDFPYSDINSFQKTYDGINNVFPSTRAADLSDMSFPNEAVSYGTTTVGSTTYGEVTGPAPGTFVTQSLDTSNFGTLVFSNVGANGKITSTNPAAFKSLQIGQTIMLNNTDPSQGGATANNGVYTITNVSSDGSTITLDQNVNAGTEPPDSAQINLTVANGTTLAMSGSTEGNNGAYTVTWPTNAELTAAGYNLAAGQVVDGSLILTNPPQVSTNPETISLNSTAFLTGTTSTTQQKISDSQSINLNVTGLDPAFEKLIRGLGILAEGNLQANPSRATQALALVNDALQHSSLQPTEEPSDLSSVADSISLNLKQLTDTKDQQTQFLTFLQERSDAIDKADPTSTAVELNAQSQALQVSYATLARISKLTLLDYL